MKKMVLRSILLSGAISILGTTGHAATKESEETVSASMTHMVPAKREAPTSFFRLLSLPDAILGEVSCFLPYGDFSVNRFTQRISNHYARVITLEDFHDGNHLYQRIDRSPRPIELNIHDSRNITGGDIIGAIARRPSITCLSIKKSRWVGLNVTSHDLKTLARWGKALTSLDVARVPLTSDILEQFNIGLRTLKIDYDMLYRGDNHQLDDSLQRFSQLETLSLRPAKHLATSTLPSTLRSLTLRAGSGEVQPSLDLNNLTALGSLLHLHIEGFPRFTGVETPEKVVDLAVIKCPDFREENIRAPLNSLVLSQMPNVTGLRLRYPVDRLEISVCENFARLAHSEGSQDLTVADGVPSSTGLALPSSIRLFELYTSTFDDTTGRPTPHLNPDEEVWAYILDSLPNLRLVKTNSTHAYGLLSKHRFTQTGTFSKCSGDVVKIPSTIWERHAIGSSGSSTSTRS